MELVRLLRIFLISVIVLGTAAHAQWDWQSPRPQGNTLLDVRFIDGSLGWASGEYGTLIHTTDGGLTWYSQEYGRTDNLLGLSMVTEMIGWAVGDNGTILRTSDGGDNWLEQASGITSGLNAVFFLDTLRGWAAGDNDLILRTTNGGITWAVQNQSAGHSSINTIFFLNPTEGWAAGGGAKVFHTTNGGAVWTVQALGAPGTVYLNIGFADTALGFIVGTNAAILRTDNGGLSWSPVTTGDNVNYNRVFMQNVYVGWIAGDGGRLLRTLNGGLSWSTTVVTPGYNFNGMTRAGGMLWTCGEMGSIFRSLNSGASWSRLDAGSRLSANWVDFPSANVGIAVGQTGLLIRTTDGGATWLESSSPVPSVSCYGVRMTDEAYGWAVGDNGTILRTTDGGAVWSPQASPTTIHTLFGISFGTPSSGWIVGTDFNSLTAAVLRSTDSGASWSLQTGGIPKILYGITFADGTTGWAVGSGGTILHTTDGGGSWNPQASGTGAALYWCAFSDPLTGWAVGDSGRILHTSNGGGTWVRQTSGVSASLFSVGVAGPTEATVAGDEGTVLRTTDGGVHWELQYSRTIYGLYGVSRNSAGIWICGDYGTVLTFTPPVITGRVTGQIYNDLNANGIRDPGEPGMGGWQVQLGGAQSGSTYSSVDGTFQFTTMPLGTYTLAQTLQPSWIQTNPSAPGTYSITLNLADTTFEGDFGNHTPSATGFNVLGEWNMISLPLEVADPRTVTLFPSATSSAYSFATSYLSQDTLRPGKGYWLKFPSAMSLWVAGVPVFADTFSLNRGWNMIGSIADTVPVSSILTDPPGIITSSVYTFTGAYGFATAILPGKAYWIKTSQEGSLSLQAAPATDPRMAPSDPPGLNTLSITDALGRSCRLFFSSDQQAGALLGRYELPPLPPEGSFDARFASGNLLAAFPDTGGQRQRAEIILQAPVLPISISWNVEEGGTHSYVLRGAGTLGAPLARLAGTGSILIDRLEARTLALSSETATGTALPADYTLEQNSPNPFNPSTSITFALPVRSHVRLEIYTLLGQRLATLEEGELDAGVYTKQWTPQGASGLYLYRMEASGAGRRAVQTRKMLYVR